MKRIALFTFILLMAAGLYAQDCKTNMDRTEQMKSALIASHGQGAYFEVNGCHWVPGKNPRDAERGPKISTQPGCKNYRVGEKHLPNVPACRKTFHTPPLALSSVVSGGVTPSTDNVVDSFYLNDSKGFLLACATHNPDTNTFVGCRLAEGRTLDELLNVTFMELQRLHDEEREP
jgi:hypothetical protein